MSREITEEVLSIERKYEGISLAEFMVMLQAAIANTPLEFRDDLAVFIENGYDGDPTTLSVTYQRPENQADRNEANAELVAYRAAEEIREREILAALKEKYEKAKT